MALDGKHGDHAQHGAGHAANLVMVTGAGTLTTVQLRPPKRGTAKV